ncbi:MAG: hypothetical protein WKF73_20900 [Nocardioidaceae bacterium]
MQAQLTQLEKDLDGESLRTQLVVSLDPASRVAEGEEIELHINVAKMHFFDPSSGESLDDRQSQVATTSERVWCVRRRALPLRSTSATRSTGTNGSTGASTTVLPAPRAALPAPPMPVRPARPVPPALLMIEPLLTEPAMTEPLMIELAQGVDLQIPILQSLRQRHREVVWARLAQCSRRSPVAAGRHRRGPASYARRTDATALGCRAGRAPLPETRTAPTAAPSCAKPT